MSEQVLIQFRADKALKQEVSGIYHRLGLDLPTALRMFMAKTVIEHGLPFEVTVPQKRTEEKAREEFGKAFYNLRDQASSLPEMTLDEINAEIAAARAERKARQKA